MTSGEKPSQLAEPGTGMSLSGDGYVGVAGSTTVGRCTGRARVSGTGLYRDGCPPRWLDQSAGAGSKTGSLGPWSPWALYLWIFAQDLSSNFTTQIAPSPERAPAGNTDLSCNPSWGPSRKPSRFHRPPAPLCQEASNKFISPGTPPRRILVF